jgi:hypothetical protein
MSIIMNFYGLSSFLDAHPEIKFSDLIVSHDLYCGFLQRGNTYFIPFHDSGHGLLLLAHMAANPEQPINLSDFIPRAYHEAAQAWGLQLTEETVQQLFYQSSDASEILVSMMELYPTLLSTEGRQAFINGWDFYKTLASHAGGMLTALIVTHQEEILPVMDEDEAEKLRILLNKAKALVFEPNEVADDLLGANYRHVQQSVWALFSSKASSLRHTLETIWDVDNVADSAAYILALASKISSYWQENPAEFNKRQKLAQLIPEGTPPIYEWANHFIVRIPYLMQEIVNQSQHDTAIDLSKTDVDSILIQLRSSKEACTIETAFTYDALEKNTASSVVRLVKRSMDKLIEQGQLHDFNLVWSAAHPAFSNGIEAG